MKTPELLVGCVCGAMPRNEEFPDGQVALLRRRKTNGYFVVCTRCGRVGERGTSPADACARWEGRRYAPYRYDL